MPRTRPRDAERRSDLAVIVGAIGIGASSALIILFGVFLARGIGRPVRAVASGATRLAGGEWSLRLPPQGPGEIGELTHAFNDMAERIEQNHAELEQQNAELRESERMKTELVSIVSHELRTPLASVLGFTALLLKREFDPPIRRHYLGIVDAQARRLAALLEDFLDVQRIEHEGLELATERVDLAALLDEQAELYAEQSPKHTVEVALDERPLSVRGDPDRLAQVVGNLLSNAIKYSPEGGTVQLAAERSGTGVRVIVRDEGLGIPEDQQERIFTKFFRGDAGATGITGTGLGLAVSREIVEAHGGTHRLRQRPVERIHVLGRAAGGTRGSHREQLEGDAQMKTKIAYLSTGVLVGILVIGPWEGSPSAATGPATIRITNSQDTVARVDVGPTGQVAGRHGDHPAAPLQPRVTTRSIGRSELICTFMDRRRARVCRGTYFLPKGRIVVGGSLLYRQFYELAVLGGTGLFDNARGSLVVTRIGVRPVRDRMVFRLVG